MIKPASIRRHFHLNSLELNHPIEAFLRLVVEVKEQRPVSSPSNREIVKPGVIVRYAPEGNSAYRILVLTKELEDLLILLVLKSNHLA